MKKLSHLLLVLAAAAFVFTACEGPMGPEGPKGDTGDTGAQGLQGLKGDKGDPGDSGTANCILCHAADQVLTAKVNQYAASTHATGVNSERNSGSCAPCHTSQGFLATLGAGGFLAIGNPSTSTVADPNQPNCYTCHSIHSTYTVDDWDLTKTASTVAAHSIDGTTATDIDLGKGNMCTGCHQARAMTTLANWDDGGIATLTASSYRWGVHHGPQYNVFVGEGLFEFAGTTSYPSTARHVSATTDGCVECHMGPAYGTQAGGHTFAMGYEYHGSMEWNFSSACEDAVCHGGKDIVDDLVEPKQLIIEGLLEDLHDALVAAGVIQTGTVYLAVDGAGAVLPQTEEHLAAAMNYATLEEDRSKGLHNFPYVEAVLLNTLEVVFGL
jgi:hypothetical protein